MQIYLTCSECLDEQIRHESALAGLDPEAPDPIGTKQRLSSYPISLTNEVSYVVNCDFGHSSAVMIDLMNHEILFETGVYALLDGYHREAITSFAASLERFYEFSVRSIALASGCSPDVVENCWPHISSQSERQLGAYIYLYAIHFKEQPRLLSQAMTALRNSAVHKGHIPSFDKAMLFGEEVLSIMAEGTDRLWKSIPDAAHKSAFAKTKQSIDKTIAAGAARPKYVQQLDSAIRKRRDLKEHYRLMRLSHSRNSITRHRKIIDS